MKNFNFGPCDVDNVRASVYGIAVKNASGTWVSYDAAKHAIVDVDSFNFSAKYLYKMPVAIKDIKAGDVVIHAHKPMFITKVNDNSFWAVDPVDGENKEIMLTLSPFGYSYCTKVVNMLDCMTNNTAPSPDNPFGNLMPMLLINNDKIDPVMLMCMSGGKLDMSNPMMMYFLMEGKK